MISDQRLCQICSDAYQVPLTFSEGGTHFLVSREDGQTVVAFRGSMGILDWARNFCFTPISFAAHAGFQASAIKAWPRVPADGPVVITGHSAGGAIATLVAAFFVSGGRPPAKVTTFGTPRTCPIIHDSIAPLLAGVPGADYRNAGDLVTEVPLGFRSPRPVRQLGAGGVDMTFADHMIGAYLQAMTDQGESDA